MQAKGNGRKNQVKPAKAAASVSHNRSAAPVHEATRNTEVIRPDQAYRKGSGPTVRKPIVDNSYSGDDAFAPNKHSSLPLVQNGGFTSANKTAVIQSPTQSGLKKIRHERNISNKLNEDLPMKIRGSVYES